MMNRKKAAIVYMSRVIGERIIGLALFLWGAGRVMPVHAGVYFAVYFGAAALSAVYLRRHGDTLTARANPSQNTPVWDKLILTAFWLVGYFVIYYAAGRTVTQGGSLWLSLAGAVLYLLSTWLTDAAIASNPFAESTARLQPERGQTVTETGPYKYIRHPMYAAILLWCIAVVLSFPTGGVAVCSGSVAVLIFTRTALEDRMLQNGLPGYKAYAARTKYRVVPGIW